jgi:integrase
MATIRKNKAGNYEARIYVGKDADGKQICEYVTRTGLKEIKAAVREIEDDIENGNYSSMKNVNSHKWFTEWLDLNKNRLSPSTMQSYKIYVNHHFKKPFGGLKLGQITDIHIKRYINDKLAYLSVTTVRKHLFVLNRMLKDSLKNKAPEIDMPAPKQYVPHIVTKEEFEKIHNHFRGKKYEPIILLAAYCGLRRGEIYGLKWNDIDGVNKTIRIDEAMSISEDGYIEKETKSHNGMRTIIVTDEILGLLEKMRLKQKVIKERIFPARPDSFTSWFMIQMDLIELPDIRFHDLRHYHATWLYQNKIPDQYAAKRLGHDINTLKKIYQHIGADTQIELDNKIIDLMKKTEL